MISLVSRHVISVIIYSKQVVLVKINPFRLIQDLHHSVWVYFAIMLTVHYVLIIKTPLSGGGVNFLTMLKEEPINSNARTLFSDQLILFSGFRLPSSWVAIMAR